MDVLEKKLSNVKGTYNKGLLRQFEVDNIGINDCPSLGGEQFELLLRSKNLFVGCDQIDIPFSYQ